MRPSKFLPAALAVVTVLLPAAVALAGGPPPMLNGPYFFQDKRSFQKITSLANIDSANGEICVAGLAAFVDTGSTLNKLVQIYFSSLGTISKETATTVEGEFVDVNLQIIFYSSAIPDPPAAFPPPYEPVLYDTGAFVFPCTMEASVRRSGEVDRADVVCELGANLADLGIPESVPNPYNLQPELPDITQQDMIGYIDAALFNRKTIKLDSKTGILRIRHVGTTLPGDNNSNLTCPTSGSP